MKIQDVEREMRKIQTCLQREKERFKHHSRERNRLRKENPQPQFQREKRSRALEKEIPMSLNRENRIENPRIAVLERESGSEASFQREKTDSKKFYSEKE